MQLFPLSLFPLDNVPASVAKLSPTLQKHSFVYLYLDFFNQIWNGSEL